MAILAVIASLCFLPHANARGGRDRLSLLDAIEQSAQSIAGDIPAGTRVAFVAFVAFESESRNLSAFIMDELVGELVALVVEVAGRRNLDLGLILK